MYFNFNQRPTSGDQFYLSIREIIILNDKDAKMMNEERENPQ